MSKTTEKITPKIYVGTYAKYNAGSLKGEWVDLTLYDDLEDFLKGCHSIHPDEADPEFMFQDFEGFPKVFWSESYIDPALWDWIELSEELSPEQMEAFEMFANHGGYELEEIQPAREMFEVAYMGYWGEGHSPREDFARHYAEETGIYYILEEAGLPPRYFDETSYKEDLFSNDFWEQGGHIFKYV